ncbi:MAG: extracellular solute-binding protein [Chloroflexi bacterium]|nr:extracellular solute-binding protein [Chloroflexota bacterium]MCI0574770.1 extracellular solute-binding protein [Chloroflexota bacterium]MCI0646409.1 extracellular solute-binding protein [Chloroflexota bacterium]MCI0725510.1 extracellular solute-binding protein [Chloroflexota bacterium]
MKKQLAVLFTLMLIGAMLLVACGGQATPTPEPQPTEAPEAEPTEAPEAAPTEEPEEVPTEEPMEETPTEEPIAEPEVTLTVWADDTRAPILQALAEQFLADYGVGLVVEQVADINDQFPIAAPAGEGPDIFIGPHDRAGGWVASGLLAPIDLGDKAGDFTEVSLSAFTFDGQLFGMPYAVENMALFINTDLVEACPASWDEVIETGAALQEAGDVTYGIALEGNGYKVYPILTAFGGYVFGQDEAGNWNPADLGVGSPGMIAAGEWMQEQIAAGVVSDNTDGETAVSLFETGEIAYIMDGPWNLERYRNSGIPYALCPFPGADQEGQPFAGVQGFMINALSENVLLAQTFLTEIVATEEVMQQLYEAGNRPSAFIPVLEATEDPDIVAFGEAGENAAVMPAIPEMGAVWGSWNDAIVLVITGEQESEPAFTNAAAQIQEVIGGAFAGMVNVPGSYQSKAGCEADWDPACEATVLTEGDDGLYTASFELPAGDYEAKVALDGAWTVNYGVDGVQDGPNYTFSLAEDGTVTFTYDPETHILTITVE